MSDIKFKLRLSRIKLEVLKPATRGYCHPPEAEEDRGPL